MHQELSACCCGEAGGAIVFVVAKLYCRNAAEVNIVRGSVIERTRGGSSRSAKSRSGAAVRRST